MRGGVVRTSLHQGHGGISRSLIGNRFWFPEVPHSSTIHVHEILVGIPQGTGILPCWGENPINPVCTFFDLAVFTAGMRHSTFWSSRDLTLLPFTWSPQRHVLHSRLALVPRSICSGVTQRVCARGYYNQDLQNAQGQSGSGPFTKAWRLATIAHHRVFPRVSCLSLGPSGTGLGLLSWAACVESDHSLSVSRTGLWLPCTTI